ncbi:MAG: PepSY-associated TM helix domain-containing protein [Cycloclasticus sp.]
MSKRINNEANNGFRQSMSWLHTWVGLVVGWLLYFMFITGSVGYFDTEIDRWMQPEIPPSIGLESPAHLLTLAEQRLQEIAPRATWWSIELPSDRNRPFLLAEWGDEHSEVLEILHPQTGKAIAMRDTGGGQLLYRMHYRLRYIPQILAEWLVSLCAMFMLMALITGVVIHRRIFKDFFTFRPSKKPRAWLDMHNVLSVLPLPFHFMITYSGLLFEAFVFMPLLVLGSYGNGDNSRDDFFDEAFNRKPSISAEVLSETQSARMQPLVTFLNDAEHRWGAGQVAYINIDNPNNANARVEVNQRQPYGLHDGFELTYDGVSGELLHSVGENISGYTGFRDVMLNLHEGLFSGIVLRWLYFLSGLMGAGMIATGMILWARKRRKQAQKSGQASKGLILIEQLNVGTIVGLPIAIAVYFWANRLIPVGFSGRADWEAHSLFIAWGCMLFYPLLLSVKRPCNRNVNKVWLEQTILAAALYGLLPVINLLITGQHLGVTLLQGNWVLAGFDLTMLGIALCLGFSAYKIGHKQSRATVRKPLEAL